MKPRIAGALIAAAAMSVPIDTAAQRVDTKQVLQRVAAYVRDYELSFASVVCEELYTQRARNVGAAAWETRELRSEIALVRTRRGDWRLFRDVFAVDGKTVRDRDERLLDLFARSDQSEALRISEESARYNIGPISRTLNVPTLALIYLTADEQSRSRFKVAGRTLDTASFACPTLRCNSIRRAPGMASWPFPADGPDRVGARSTPRSL